MPPLCIVSQLLFFFLLLFNYVLADSVFSDSTGDLQLMRRVKREETDNNAAVDENSGGFFQFTLGAWFNLALIAAGYALLAAVLYTVTFCYALEKKCASAANSLYPQDEEAATPIEVSSRSGRVSMRTARGQSLRCTATAREPASQRGEQLAKTQRTSEKGAASLRGAGMKTAKDKSLRAMRTQKEEEEGEKKEESKKSASGSSKSGNATTTHRRLAAPAQNLHLVGAAASLHSLVAAVLLAVVVVVARVALMRHKKNLAKY